MMEPIKLPEQFEGIWMHAIILTYGMHIPFFERTIWRSLDRRCRNVILIGDGERYINACRGYAESKTVRWLNQKYIADGVFGTTFHPKMILLTSPQRGRLLIGSGNLSIQGYASGGEMFVKYSFGEGHKKHLDAFIAARSYLEFLVRGSYLRPRTERQINQMLEQTPWLYHGVPDNEGNFRSNLVDNFLNQFKTAVGDEDVEELWILSPFFDEKNIALLELLDALRPRVTHLLIQDGVTSIDQDSLVRVISTKTNDVHIHPVELPGGGVTIHNKLYVANTSQRSICIQGSPNLTQSAFRLIPPNGNFELANLLIGEPYEFNPLFEALEVYPEPEDLDDLKLEYLGGDKEDDEESEESSAWLLIGGEWQRDDLRIFYKGVAPNLNEIFLIVGEDRFSIESIDMREGYLKCKITKDVGLLLENAIPVQIVWNRDELTNPIYPLNLDELDRTIDVEDDDVYLPEVGDLELEDKELEALLHELENALVYDMESVSSIWQQSTDENKQGEVQDSDAPHIPYDEIDYEMLRSHPKLAQYREWHPGGLSYRKTKLQIILGSITAHFNGLVEIATGEYSPVPEIVEIEEDELDAAQEDADEIEALEAEHEKTKKKRHARMRNVMKGFIRRYLKGISSPKFLKIVDCDLVINNYVIFSHILWRLFGREWFEDKFVVDSYLKMFDFMWGTKGKSGYFTRLSREEKEITIEIISRNKGLGRMMAAIYYSDYLATYHNWVEIRFKLRDLWRHYLDVYPIEIDENAIVEHWVLLQEMDAYDPPRPSRLVEKLIKLEMWETNESFLRELEKKLKIPKYSCRFSRNPVNVIRPKLGKQVRVRQLEIASEEGLHSFELAGRVCQLWIKFQPKKFYRIVSTNGNYLLIYDKEFGRGLYLNKVTGLEMDITELPLLSSSRRCVQLEVLKDLTSELDSQIQIGEYLSQFSIASESR